METAIWVLVMDPMGESVPGLHIHRRRRAHILQAGQVPSQATAILEKIEYDLRKHCDIFLI